MGNTEDVILIINNLTSTIKDLKKQPGEWYEKLDKIVTVTVKEVENLHESMKGQDKKALAEAVILDIWFKNFNVRWIPDFIERPAAKKLVAFIVDKAIEAAVSLFNRTGVFKK